MFCAFYNTGGVYSVFVSNLFIAFSGAEVLLTFGQRVPAGPVGDPLIKEVPTVPTLVHPAVSIRVGPRQLTSHTQMQMLWIKCPIIRNMFSDTH